jgi:hypothetical protein
MYMREADLQMLNGEYCVARWDGANWIELTGADDSLHAPDYIASLIRDSQGNIYRYRLLCRNNIGYGIAKWTEPTGPNLEAVPGSFSGIYFRTTRWSICYGPIKLLSQNY